MVHAGVGTLTGGEKARLVLAMLVWQRPNLLLLDEPTNHLDLTTREALSMALNEFEGTVMLVSHDRALLREVCDEFWLVAAAASSPSTATSTTTSAGCSSRRKRPRDARAARAGGAQRRARLPAPRPPPPRRREPPARGPQGRRRAARAAARRAAKPLRKELNRVDERLACLAEREALEAAMRRERGRRRRKLRRDRAGA